MDEKKRAEEGYDGETARIKRHYRLFRPDYRIIILIIMVFVSFTFISQESGQISVNGMTRKPFNRRKLELKKIEMIPGSKWIVVTTVQEPTMDIQNLANQQDWNLVVVADTKTPSTWEYAGVHFLSLEDQHAVFGKFSELLPYKSYTRKNLGYLYAIMNGAEWIYDTDDDNKPHGLGLNQFDYNSPISGLRYVPKEENISTKLFNPYRFYGYENMWPRGFPLEYLEEHTNGRDRMVSCREMPHPAVQQGVVRSDPDVDAIYRLLHAQKGSGLNVTFNKIAPSIVLEKGTYSPWNSQNTLFHYKAFFILYLPSSVAFRVTDIWRSYFGQKLLHLIGENVAFYPTNAIQFRNAHNFLNDFHQEIDVYEKSGEMIEFLDDWNCSAATTVECVKELADKFVQLKFFGQQDRNLIEVWLEQLTSLGYEFPPLVNGRRDFTVIGEKFGKCRAANFDVKVEQFDNDKEEKTLNWATKTVDGFGEILNWCHAVNGTNDTFLPPPGEFVARYRTLKGLQRKNNTVLVLINNYHWLGTPVIGLLQRMYSPFFKTTIFCGTWDVPPFANISFPPIEPLNFINLTPEEMRGGAGYGYCASKIRELRLQNVEGYYFLADDATFNIWHDVPQEKFVNAEPIVEEKDWWRPDDVRKSYNLFEGKYKNHSRIVKSWQRYKAALSTKYPRKNVTDHYLNVWRKTIGDFLFIPQGDTLEYVGDLMEVLAEAGVFVEVAYGKIMDGLNFDRILNFNYLWRKRRSLLFKPYNTKLIGMHPTKLTGTEDDLNYRKQ